jgi:hypothetical protein
MVTAETAGLFSETVNLNTDDEGVLSCVMSVIVAAAMAGGVTSVSLLLHPVITQQAIKILMRKNGSNFIIVILV